MTDYRRIGPMDLTAYDRSDGRVYEIGRWDTDEGDMVHLATLNAEEMAALNELGSHELQACALPDEPAPVVDVDNLPPAISRTAAAAINARADASEARP